MQYEDCIKSNLYLVKIIEDLENLNGLALLQKQVKGLVLQEKLGKQNFDEDIKKLEPVTSTVKQGAKEMRKAVKDTNKANELKEKKKLRQLMNKIVENLKYGINFVLRLLEPLGERTNFKNASRFRLRVKAISKEPLLNENVPIVFHR